MPGLRENRNLVIASLGVTQILGWGCSFYFPAVLAQPVVRETGWSYEAVIAGVTVGLMVAGLVSPHVGRLIARHGGRPVLAASSVLFAAGMALLAVSPNLGVYLFAWAAIGLAMGSGLYDAVFAALGRLYGTQARGAIASITLFGGFASTVCWPLSAWLELHLGWRGTCLVYAALHLIVALPLQFVAPNASDRAPAMPVQAQDDVPRLQAAPPAAGIAVFALLAAAMTLTTAVGTILLVHLMTFLSLRGIDTAQAVALGALFGPAQVGARVVERLFGERYHPLWTLAVATVLMAAGLVLLAAGAAFPALTIVLFGAGFGISWIARGTVPLALFGAQRYPVTIGRLALPSLIGQALAPTVGALLIARAGGEATMAVLAAATLLNLLLVALLWSISGYRPFR